MPPKADGSLSGETSSEEMIPDHLLPRRIPPVPPLPRRLRSVQISTSGATSSAALPRRVRSETSSSPELREDDTTSSSESGSAVEKTSERGRVIRHMDDLRAKLMQALTKRAKMSHLHAPGRLHRCHVHCLPAPNSAPLSATLCKVGRRCQACVPCRGWRVRAKHLTCCSRPWSTLNIMDHAQDRLDGCPTLQATAQATISSQLDRNRYRARVQVAYGHRQLRVPLVSSHACLGWSYRDACQLRESKQLALLCVTIALTLLCYAALIMHRHACLVFLRSPTLNATKRRARLPSPSAGIVNVAICSSLSYYSLITLR